ncbi:MAG: ROK family protein [Anaerolineales bacterium]|nr:ROK family protein [Anaerolineales bacterium]
MSLADLHAVTPVSLPTLRKAVQSLLDARWIRVVGQAEANGGRPAMLFGVNDSHFAIVGIHLQLPGIHLTLSDLAGKVLDDGKVFDGVLPTPDECVQTITEYAARIKTTFPKRELLGVGVAAPGFIDLATGDIISIGRVPSWVNVPICRRLRAALSLPVYIANDVDCLAFAELQYTHQTRESNLAYIGFDQAIKVSLFLKGELYKGTFGNAGLIAPSLLRVDELSNPEETPHLLTISGVSQLFEERLRALDADAQKPYAEIIATASPRERVRRILENARPDMPICYSLVLGQIRVLAGMAASMILMLQPDVVLIGGLLSLLPQELFANLETAIRRHLPALISHNTLIRQGKLALQSSGAIGATHHFLQTYLSQTNNELA